jgi:hypothetical protein
MNELEKIKELDRLAGRAGGADAVAQMDVTGAVLARIRGGEQGDPRILGDGAPIRILAGASLLGVAAALVVVVMVWAMMDAPVDSIDMVAQQTTEWLQ